MVFVEGVKQWHALTRDGRTFRGIQRKTEKGAELTEKEQKLVGRLDDYEANLKTKIEGLYRRKAQNVPAFVASIYATGLGAATGSLAPYSTILLPIGIGISGHLGVLAALPLWATSAGLLVDRMVTTGAIENRQSQLKAVREFQLRRIPGAKIA